MVSSCTKKVVVIRNIPSNIIEEAILILRSGPDNNENVGDKKASVDRKKQNDDHLLKEAEIIINNYIKENKLHIETKKRGFKKGFLKGTFLSNIYFTLALAGGILFLIILVIKALV